ncbi:MAG: 30S ribosomal protein S4 [Methanocellales archaeon]|nr:30S ribosomal protein S4 [Methanocellales archaeon]
MGYPGKSRKRYEPPSHPWQAVRMADEVALVKKYGLRNKRELWKVHSILRKYRRAARKLLARSTVTGEGDHAKEKEIKTLEKLKKMNLLEKDAKLDDVLALKTEDILERRLQTQVHRQGLANSMGHARQLITHGHIAVAGRRVTVPSYLVRKDEETQIGYYVGSPMTTKSSKAKAKATE